MENQSDSNNLRQLYEEGIAYFRGGWCYEAISYKFNQTPYRVRKIIRERVTFDDYTTHHKHHKGCPKCKRGYTKNQPNLL